MKRKYAILILAAGESRRLGHPKQLVLFKNKTLLQHTIDISLLFNNSQTYLILGAHYEQIASSIKNVDTIYNEEWSKGMGQSISKGIKAISDLNYDGVLILLCDQPFLSKSHLSKIYDVHAKKKVGIVASRYNSQIGAPCFFGKKYFDKLGGLDGEKGAKSIILKNIDDCHIVDFDLGQIDIDTPEDLENLLSS